MKHVYEGELTGASNYGGLLLDGEPLNITERLGPVEEMHLDEDGYVWCSLRFGHVRITVEQLQESGEAKEQELTEECINTIKLAEAQIAAGQTCTFEEVFDERREEPGEREADEDIAAGRVKSFKSLGELADWLEADDE